MVTTGLLLALRVWRSCDLADRVCHRSQHSWKAVRVVTGSDKFGKTLTLQVLPGTQGIYGF